MKQIAKGYSVSGESVSTANRLATVDHQFDPGDEASLIGSEKCNRRGDFLGPAESAERNGSFDLADALGALRRITEGLIPQRRLDCSRQDAVAAEGVLFLREMQCERACQAA